MRLRAGLAAIVTTFALAVALVATPPAATAKPYQRAAEGSLLRVSLKDLMPTQAAIGYDQIYSKLGRYASDKDQQRGKINARFDDYCETDGRGTAATALPGARLDNPLSFSCQLQPGQETTESKKEMKTVVIGPGGKPYLTDGHHTMSTLLAAPDGGRSLTIRVRVQANMSALSPKAFWDKMKSQRWVWLYDADDRPISEKQLPSRIGLGAMSNDRYRGLVYFTRGVGYNQVGTEFNEFYWGRYLRTIIPKDRANPATLHDYLETATIASRAMVALPGSTVLGDGRTATELGQMATWNDGKPATKGEFGDLAKPYTDAKPGKIAYALTYRNR